LSTRRIYQMKLFNKKKRAEQRERLREKKLEEERKKNTQIIKILKSDQITFIKKYNHDLITSDEISKDDMIKLLELFFQIISNSSYIDEVLRMTRQNISTSWFDKNIDIDFIKEIFVKELDRSKVDQTGNVVLRLCYWANRISHHVETEAMNGQIKHKMNDIYTRYFLNPKYHYDITNAIDSTSGKLYSDINQKLQTILIKEIASLGDITTSEQLHNLFLGLNLRNELWTLKQELLKILLKESQMNENTNIKITALEEKNDVSINGSSTLRIIIRELYGIAPIIMHCDKEKIEEYLKKANLKPIPIENSKKIVEFAQNGKVGIHFTLDEDDRDIFEYESLNNPKVDELYNIMYRGESDEGR